MSWSSSIHIRSSSFEDAVRIVRDVVEAECFVGRSGEGWVSVYSERCEASSGEETPKLAEELCEHSEGYVLAVHQGEEGFAFWLFHQGILVDRHPLGGAKLSAPAVREIFKLAPTNEAKHQIEAALIGRRSRRPHEVLGMTESEFISKAQDDRNRMQSMSPDELRQMTNFYALLRASASPAKKLSVLCGAIGIDYYDLNYSDVVALSKSGELGRQLNLTRLP
jgi:hypothetical protein